MSKIAELIKRLERLPDIETIGVDTEKYKAFTEKIVTAFDALHVVAGQADCVRLVFKRVKLPETNRALSQTPKAAGVLHKKIDEDRVEIRNSTTNDKIMKFGEQNKSAQSELQKKWKSELDESLKPIMPLARVAEDAKLTGHKKITKRIEALEENKEALPTKDTQAAIIKDELAELKKEIKELKLEGPGGKFLMKAVNGNAKPKDLLRDDVQKFLDEKDLWQILVVATQGTDE